MDGPSKLALQKLRPAQEGKLLQVSASSEQKMRKETCTSCLVVLYSSGNEACDREPSSPRNVRICQCIEGATGREKHSQNREPALFPSFAQNNAHFFLSLVYQKRVTIPL